MMIFEFLKSIPLEMMLFAGMLAAAVTWVTVLLIVIWWDIREDKN